MGSRNWAPAGWDEQRDGKFEWNNGYWTEGLDRCSTVRLLLENMLLDHPAVKRAGIATLITQALANIDEPYQTLGHAAFAETKDS